MMAQRLENYRVGVLAQYVADYSRAKTLPVVLPILLAHQKGGWKASLSYMELIQPTKPLERAPLSIYS